MPELSRKIKYVIDLNAPLVPGTMSGVMMEGDDRADTIEVQLMNGMAPVAASSVASAAVAKVTNNDGQTLMNVGTVEDVIRIPLDASCYAVPGRAKIRVQVTDNEGVDRTIMTVWGTVEANGEGVAIDPGGNLPSYADLLVIKQEMLEATAAAETRIDAAIADAETRVDEAIADAETRVDTAVAAAQTVTETTAQAGVTALAAAAQIDGKADAILQTASGELVHVEDSADAGVREITLYGMSTQDGTPSPENPAPITSVAGDGTMEVTAENPNLFLTESPVGLDTLCAIPVPSGGNVTIDGQQYVADTLTVRADGSGKVRSEIAVVTLDGTATIETITENGFKIIMSEKPDADRTANCMCTHYLTKSASGTLMDNHCMLAMSPALYIQDSRFTTVDDFANYLSEQYEAGTPVTVVYRMLEPQVTDLTAAQVEQLLWQYGQPVELYGVCDQNGTPSPDAPVPIATKTYEMYKTTTSLTDLAPLCAMPVSSGGNVTIDGQQYVADTLTVRADGTWKTKKMFNIIVLTGSEVISNYRADDNTDTYYGFQTNTSESYPLPKSAENQLSNTFVKGSASSAGYHPNVFRFNTSGRLYMRVEIAGVTSAETFKQWLQNKYDSGNPVCFMYEMADPQVTDLTAAQVEQLLSLRTYKTVTNLYNDQGAQMDITYVADTKTYIDNKFAELAAAIVQNV